MDLGKLYAARFPAEDLEGIEAVWRVLCGSFFQRYVRDGDAVLDLGAGSGVFLRNIRCGARIAVEINPEAGRRMPPGTRLVARPCWDLAGVEDGSVDVVFASNIFEHLPDKEKLLLSLAEARRVLAPAGRFLILQPNLAALDGRFFDFLDHNLPLTDRSMTEALLMSDFRVERCVPRFLPFTTRSAIPQAPWLVRLYLACPWAWPVMGRQMFIVAVKAAGEGRPS